MLVSIIIKTKDEANRLRLVLASLARQTIPITDRFASGTAAEVVVVNDGSTDHTADVLEESAAWLPHRTIHLDPSQGRAAATNAGVRAAHGEVLLFIDGDSLVGPDFVRLHAEAHAAGRLMGRGETHHLRCTRFFHDPETGSPQPGQEEAVRRMGADRERNLITRSQIDNHFLAIDRRAQPGLYPGVGPRKLFDLEWDGLVNHPRLGCLWMAAAGQNSSVQRADFEAVGGFDERLTINEHREFAFRLAQRGVSVGAVPGARSYHLTHRTGWRDPLVDKEWERLFYAAHPCFAVALMSIFWLSVSDDAGIPENLRIHSLAHFESVVGQGDRTVYDAVRRTHPRLGAL